MELPTWTNGITDVLGGVWNVIQAQRADINIDTKIFCQRKVLTHSFLKCNQVIAFDYVYFT